MPLRITTPFAFDPTYREVVLADSPIAYYRLGDAGGTAADISGNILDGTYVNGPSTTTSLITNNEGDLARNFVTASTHYVNVADTALLRPGDTSWTVEMWAQLPDATNLYALVTKRQNVFPRSSVNCLQAGDTGGTITGRQLNFQYQSHQTTNYRHALTSNIADGLVHHLVYVADKDADTLRIYVDTVDRVITQASNGTWPNITNTDPLRIGEGNGFGAMTGVMDEVAIYNYALSAARVLAHYNAGI